MEKLNKKTGGESRMVVIIQKSKESKGGVSWKASENPYLVRVESF